MRSVLALLLLLMASSPAWAAFPTTTAPTTSVETTTVTTHNITVPACSAGKLYLIFSVFDSSAAIITWPVGANVSTVAGTSTAGGGSATYVTRYRFANGTDAQIDVTSDIAIRSSHHVYCITGAHASTPPSFGTPTQTTTTLNPNPPSATASWGVDDNLYFVVTGTGVGNSTDLSTCPAGYTTNCSETDHGAGTIATGRGTFSSATENPGTFTFTGTAVTFVSNTVVVRPSAALIQPCTGFSNVTGNSWDQASGVCTPHNGYSLIRWNTPSGPAQQAAWVVNTLPDDNWTIQVSARMAQNNPNANRVRLLILRVPGTNNDTATLDELVDGVPVWTVGPINLGVDIKIGDQLGLDITAGGAIKATYWSVDAAWATLCAGGGDWCIIATGTATVNPDPSYIGMAAKEPASAASFSGTLSTPGAGTSPSIPANCTATPVPGNTSLILNCDASTGDVASYQDHCCVGGGCSNFAMIRDTQATSYLWPDLDPVTSHSCQRRACGGSGCSAFSSTFSGTTSDVPAAGTARFGTTLRGVGR